MFTQNYVYFLGKWNERSKNVVVNIVEIHQRRRGDKDDLNDLSKWGKKDIWVVTVEIVRQKGREIDRETKRARRKDRQINRQTKRRTKRQTVRLTSIQTDTRWKTNKWWRFWQWRQSRIFYKWWRQMTKRKNTLTNVIYQVPWRLGKKSWIWKWNLWTGNHIPSK